MFRRMKTFLFYLKYYLTNHVVMHLPCHCLRLFWLRRIMGLKIGRNSQVWLGCKFYGDAISQIEIGDDSVLAYGVTINAAIRVRIEDHVQIASGVSIHTADHDCQDAGFAVRIAQVTIGTRSYVASNAIILKGVTLGEGAVVSAGAVVFQDVKAFTIVAGNPARSVGTRVPSGDHAPLGKPPYFC